MAKKIKGLEGKRGKGRREGPSRVEILGGVISEFLEEHFAFLDRMQRATQVTEKEVGKMVEIEGNFKNLAQSYAALGNPLIEDFSKLHDLYDAAKAAVDRAELIADSVEIKKEHQVDNGEILKDTRESWNQNFEYARTSLGALNGATDEEAVPIMRYLDEDLFPYFQASKESLSLELGSATHSEKMKNEVRRILSEIDRYLSEYAQVKQDREQIHQRIEHVEKDESERRGIGEHFQAAIQAFHEKIGEVDALPLGSEEEVQAARSALDRLASDLGGYRQQWIDQVRPILSSLRPGVSRAWDELLEDHRALCARFFDEKSKSGPDASLGFEQEMRDRIAQKSQEFGAAQWEEMLPNFLLSLDSTDLSILDARMLGGKEREDELKAIAETFEGQEGQWRDLRRLGPREQNRERSVVHQLDRRIAAMRRYIKELIEYAPQSRSQVLDRLEQEWRRAILRADFWTLDSSVDDRIAQLEAFTNSDLLAEDNFDLLTLVRPERRNDFLTLASGSSSRLFKAFRARGRRERKDIETQKRRERAELYHPKLSFLRMQEAEAYEAMGRASFWKNETTWSKRKAAMRTNSALSDEQLADLVSDIGAYRNAFEDLEAHRRAVRDVEDLLLSGNNLSSETNTEGVRNALNTYGAQARREDQLWGLLINSTGWKISKKEKNKKLHTWHKSFQKDGQRSLRGVPAFLRSRFIDWIYARQAWNITGAYAQWIIYENPEVVRHFKGIPQIFELPASLEGSEDSAIDVAEVIELQNDDTDHDDREGFTTGAFVHAIDSVSDSAPEASVALDASQPEDTSSPVTPEAAPVTASTPDARHEAITNREKEIRALLADGMFWKPETRPMNRVNRVKSLLKRGSDARLTSNVELQPDRVEDFYHALAFTSFEDLQTRIAELRAKYAPPVVNPVVSSVTPESVVATPGSAPVDVPSVPAVLATPESVPAAPVAPVAPSVSVREGSATATQVETLRAPSTVTSEVPSSRREAAPAASRVRESSLPVAPALASSRVTPAPTARTREVPLASVETSRPASESVATPEATPTPVHAEERVSSWARSIRERVSGWFGGGVREARVETPSATPERSTREEREAVLQTTGTILRTVGKIFGFKVIAKIPEYFTEEFCNDSRRVTLREELLSAVEDGMKGKQGDPEARRLANLKAAERVERAISTDATKTPEQRAAMLQKVNELRDRYETRSRESMDACNKELGKLVETWVTKKTSAWSVAKEMKNSVLRALTLGGMAASESAQGLARGVMSFREKLEAVAVRDREMDLVGRVATVFRESWEETWQRMTTRAETVSESAVDIAQALETLNAIAGMTGMNIDAAVTSLSGLRTALAERPSPQMRERVGLAQLEVQENIDRLLSGVLRRARR